MFKIKLDTFYIDNKNYNIKENYGYMRTVVTRFRKGSSHADDPEKSYVKAVVQHQFRSDCGTCLPLSFDCSVSNPQCFQAFHKDMMSAVQGKLKDINDQLTMELSSSAWGPVDTSPIKRKLFGHFVCRCRIKLVLRFHYKVCKSNTSFISFHF